MKKSPLPRPPFTDLRPLLPRPLCALGDVKTGRRALTPPAIYTVWPPLGSGRPIYVGETVTPLRVRLLNHQSWFGEAFLTDARSDSWRVSWAPVEAYSSFVAACIERASSTPEGMAWLPTPLQRGTALWTYWREMPESWLADRLFVEAIAIAALAPRYNVESNRFRRTPYSDAAFLDRVVYQLESTQKRWLRSRTDECVAA